MRWLRLAIVVLVAGALAATQAARYLVVNNAEKSDAIVVLAGETGMRPERALELLRQGMAPRIVQDAEAGAEVFNEPLTDIAQKYVNSLPEANRITICAIEGRSTVGETSDVARCLQPFGVHRVLIVTSDYHSRRALSIFEHQLPQYQWSIAAAHNPAAFGEEWWTHREWAKTTFDEWEKLIWWAAVDRWK